MKKTIKTYNELLALLTPSTCETKTGIQLERKCVDTIYLIEIDPLKEPRFHPVPLTVHLRKSSLDRAGSPSEATLAHTASIVRVLHYEFEL